MKKRTILGKMIIILIFISFFLFTFSTETSHSFSENFCNYKLKSVCIIPTSIARGIENNFAFSLNGEICIKIESFVVGFNDRNFELACQPVFAPKNKKTELLPEEAEIFTVWGNDFNFSFRHHIKTGFLYRKEPAIINNAPVVFSVKQKVDETSHRFCFKNINASSNGFSYNLELVFEC